MRRHILRPDLAIRETHVVLQQHSRQNHLDLITGEEAAGTGILAVAEVQVVGIRGGELMAIVLLGLLPCFVEAEAVEDFGGRDHRGVV